MKQIQDEESEFRRVTKEYLERLNEFVSKTQRDEGETARITFDVPVEWLSLFAWLEARHAQRARDEWDMSGHGWMKPADHRNGKRTFKPAVRDRSSERSTLSP